MTILLPVSYCVLSVLTMLALIRRHDRISLSSRMMLTEVTLTAVAIFGLGMLFWFVSTLL